MSSKKLPFDLCKPVALVIFITIITAMRKPLLIITLLVAVIYACNQKGIPKNALLQPSALASEFFTVDITKDTTLATKKGAMIRIPKGALSAGNASTVQLEVKEAYTIREIIRAGLNTQSDGRPLSSGGMIYINAVGENTVRITEALSVALPAPYIDMNMQVFKGEVKSDSTVNWTAPDSLSPNEELEKLQRGMTLFNNNCARCHGIGVDLTGPDLANVSRRLGWEGEPDYFGFTQNAPAVLASGNVYFNCLYEKWGKSPMPAFPQLTNEDLHALYDYIENESDRRGLPAAPDCQDSCENYFRLKAGLEEKRDALTLNNNSNSLPSGSDTTGSFADMIVPSNTRPVYYEFKIEQFGWYNVDVLLKGLPGFEDSKLMVRIQGEYKASINVYLIIPSIRAFIAGGLLEGKVDEYGFFDRDGSIPLPQNEKAYIMAMTEKESKILYNSVQFITGRSGNYELVLNETDIEQFNAAIKSIGLEDLKITAGNSKNAARIREIDEKINSLKPDNCGCMCAWYEAKLKGAGSRINE